MNQTNPINVPERSSIADALIAGAIIGACMYLSACGITAGPLTAGTTSFLAEANRGRLIAAREVRNENN